MASLVGLRIPLPQDDNEFEDITFAATRLRWPPGYFDRNSTRGQRQDGVDIFGDDDSSRAIGIQCMNLEKQSNIKRDWAE